MQSSKPPAIVSILIFMTFVLVGVLLPTNQENSAFSRKIVKLIDVPNDYMLEVGFSERSHIGWQLKEFNLFTPWIYNTDGRWVVYGNVIKNNKKRMQIKEINFNQAREFATASNQTIEPIPDISWFQLFYPLIFVSISLCVLACLSFILKSQVPPPYNKNTLYAILHPILISDEWKWLQDQTKKRQP